MNIMDESFLSQLSWDENGMLENNLEDPAKRVKFEQPSPMPSPGSPLIAENKLLSNPGTDKPRQKSDPIPNPGNKMKMQTQTYQLIKPGPAPPKSATPNLKIQPQISTTTNQQVILTQNRPNIITTTTPSTILLSNSNFYNLKTISSAGAQQISLATAKSQNQSQSRTNTPAPANTAGVPIVQPILTFQTADQKPLVLQANPVVYTTSGDHRTVSLLVSDFF